MSLSDNDVTNVERGVDAGIQTILGMAQETVLRHAQGGRLDTHAQMFVGFCQALLVPENMAALRNKALLQVLEGHPDRGTAKVEITEEIPDDA